MKTNSMRRKVGKTKVVSTISAPRSLIGSVPCVPSYTLSSTVFKGSTRGISFKHTSPPICYPWYMQDNLFLKFQFARKEFKKRKEAKNVSH